ncbi:hypothetical protein CTI12_AA585140 [Artemisia annua]|uniref:Uncharacterized protein n=1 Tax=Artemisia annua TaxID=35608 RepID=A0A2U1KMM7_ARTAN|nr:hypothetical protein CTI12_AA585140 [Artemisia annua]
MEKVANALEILILLKMLAMLWTPNVNCYSICKAVEGSKTSSYDGGSIIEMASSEDHVADKYYGLRNNHGPWSAQPNLPRKDPVRSKIADSLDNIVHALDRNSKVIESSRPHVYTEKEIYEELQCMGLSKEDIQPAYAFLLEHPVQTRGLFGCPFEARGDYLKTVMGIDK